MYFAASVMNYRHRVDNAGFKSYTYRNNVRFSGTLFHVGLGYALFSPLNTYAITSSVKKEYLGIASGMVATMRSVGKVLSMVIAMLCFLVYSGTETIPSLYLTGFMTAVRISFFIFTWLCALGIFALYVHGTIR